MDEKNEQPKILHPRLSYAIIGAAMNVHSELGPGWDEEIYHKALLHALHAQGIKAESKLRGVLENHDLIADEFELDILVEDSIVLELKHIVKPFAPAHYCQLINYLKFWGKDLGILINFGLERLEYKRVPFSPMVGTMTRNELWNTFSEENNKTAKQIYSILNAVFNDYGLGYSTKTYNGLFITECKFQKTEYDVPSVNLSYQGSPLGEKIVDAFRINEEALILISALNDQSSAIDLARLLSYMKQTKIKAGILANFGKTTLHIRLLTP